MRELKFRAWDGKQMLYSGGRIEQPDAFNCFFEHFPGLSLMQYTGLKDKNGQEIYEGDILSDGAVVEWFQELGWDGGGSIHPGFYCKKWTEYQNENYTDLSYDEGFSNIEIIGNIYENPELVT